MIVYRWDERLGDERGKEALARELEVSRLLAGMLWQRGFRDPESAWAFLNPSLENLHDPDLMQDMGRVTERIFQARDRREKVLICGDYDVDGITSTVILRRALEMLGVEADFHLPRRLEDGYGLKTEVVRRASERGFRVIVTADTGIRAFQPCRLARELGVDLIVTDHHLPDERLPEAYAILNPRRFDCAYPDKDLAAVGVVFKLIHSLFKRVGRENVIRHFLKLASIGTIADLVPLIGENRIICKFGLEGLSQPHNLGLKALLEGSGVSREVNHFDIGFKVAPRINAVTRMGGGSEVVDLFSIRNLPQAQSIVQEMNEKNVRRRAEEERIMAEIEGRIEADPEAFKKRFLVVAGQGWHRGVIGIVASRLSERFYRPSLVLSVDERGFQGSGRSIPGFHLLQAMDACRDLFSQYGGHAQAAGCAIDPGRGDEETIRELSHRLEGHARKILSEEDLTPSLPIESLLPVDRLDLGLYSEVSRLEPFGIANPVPLFATKNAKVAGGPWLLKDKHLKLRIQRNGSSVAAIWWRRTDLADRIEPGSLLDIAYCLSRDQYQGEAELSLSLRDVRLRGA